MDPNETTPRPVLGKILGRRPPTTNGNGSRSLPYVPGSDTSREAAEGARLNAGTRRRYVYEILRKRGSRGATDDELEVATGWVHQTVSARRRELVLDGLVRDAGERRKTRSGRSATVWEAVP